ncbi:stage V sporulation protein AD [Vulcanibacillus modesticaldus]|uniref:stage V sporulation protein AD n=1 Tax=Vulcanibacillus modesticaldus TaxID=337097 RepID=UPI000A8300CD|nr:stage V sporulation protein AD [Vulcanibacillus modesticaldus]
MKTQLGRSTWEFSKVRILSSAVAVGPLEGQGPLANDFDIIHEDLYIGQDTWEKAERKLFEEALDLSIKKAGLTKDQINLMIAGDLLNQIISASFTATYSQIPYLGVYGACSTSMEALALSAALIEGDFADYIVSGCSSHNSTAEKQYRYPTEYGGQKPPYAQWTVTGSGVAIVGKGLVGPRVKYATIGKIVDMGLKDPFDMGSAMAPAAVDTIVQHFKDTGRNPEDYDLIVTGDLASVGYPIAKKLLLEQGYDMSTVYNDCGLMIYSPNQEVFAGGSGCASSAVVTYGHIMKKLNQKEFNKVLVVATGALLSPISYQQGESIPCIAHAVAIENEED